MYCTGTRTVLDSASLGCSSNVKFCTTVMHTYSQIHVNEHGTDWPLSVLPRFLLSTYSLHHRLPRRRMPAWAWKVFLRGLGRIVCMASATTHIMKTTTQSPSVTAITPGTDAEDTGKGIKEQNGKPGVQIEKGFRQMAE